MFLISLVFLLGLAVGARAEELEVPWGETLVISDVCEVGSFLVEGCLIVTATGHLFSNGSDGRSTIDGNGGDGEGGLEYAQLIINGGQVTVQSRFNIGQDHDGRLIVNDGGYFSQECCGDDWDDGFKFPDDDGGEHFIIVNDGEVHVHKFEAISDRHAKIELGCWGLGGLLTIDECEHGHEREDPFEWEAAGDLYCSSGCFGPIINYVGDGAEAYCMPGWVPPWCSWWPGPWDGSTGVCLGVCLTWFAGYGMGAHPGDKHYVYFGTSYDAVDDAEIGDPPYRGFKPVGLEEYCPIEDPTLGYDIKLWTTYYWRVDEKPFGEPTRKCAVWSFTTGCSLVPGDINLDCVVNLIDYAMLADDWRDESFFPSGVVP